jgi:DNA-binding MarR family transcriptional regulator
MWTHELQRLETLLGQGLGDDASEAGLAESEARLLLALEPGEHVAMNELARRLGRDPTTATRFADRVERRGLLTRRAGSRDRRQRMAVLTPEGAARREALCALRDARARRLLETVLEQTGLGEGQVAWFLGALLAGLESDRARQDASDADAG